MKKMLEVTNPVNGKLVEAIPYSDRADVLNKVAKATAAKALWAATPLYKRAQYLYKFIELIGIHTEEVATLLSTEMGKPIVQARAEVGGSANIFRGFVERACHLYGEVLPCDNQPGLHNDLIFSRREPLGVLACIIPFNYPVELYVHKVAPALIMGNCCIVKAPSLNPLAMLKFDSLWAQTGIPEGVIQSLVCERDVCSEALLTNPDIAAISLTGSSKAGVEMVKNGADTMKHLFLELSGNDGNIIRPDADLDYAISEMLGGRIFNAGQTCCAAKRFIVHKSIYNALAEKLVEALKKLKIGDALDETVDMSTVISEAAAKKIISQVEYTVQQGATLLYGGTRDGAFVKPTVLTNVDKSYDVASNLEIFGPVFPLIPYETDEEAVEIINNCRNGLSAGIITKDLKAAICMASKIESGAVVCNGQSSYRHMEQAFGGYKMTGLGREGVCATLEDHSQVKSYIIKGVFDFA